jgi:hypothetical protein
VKRDRELDTVPDSGGRLAGAVVSLELLDRRQSAFPQDLLLFGGLDRILVLLLIITKVHK